MQTIELDHGNLKVQTKAYVFGEWAAHRATSYEGHGWRVSHVPTGIGTWNLCDGPEMADAVRIARLLSERVPVLFLAYAKARRPGAAPAKMPDDDSQIIIATFGEVLGS